MVISMRLYRMELYKLCHRKVFIIGSGCVIAILIVLFLTKLWEEEAYVNGVTYYGYQAVQINRKITEEFKGTISDEKAEKIIEKYGFPHEAKEYHGYYVDANFLTRWVTEYLSDGYFYGWDNYQIPTYLKAIEETELQEIMEVTGEEIILEYSDGWIVYGELLTLGHILGSILILFGISIVFANEGQTKMLPLLFTTKEGKGKDIFAKIAAAFTVAIGVWIGITVLAFLLCSIVYGLDGLKCLTGISKMVRFINLYYSPVSVIPVSSFLMVVVFRSFLGIMLLCSMTVYISACYRSSFHAVISASICWMLPILLLILFGNIVRLPIIWLLVYASPIYSVLYDSLVDVYQIWIILAWISAAWMMIGIINSYRRYRKIL